MKPIIVAGGAMDVTRPTEFSAVFVCENGLAPKFSPRPSLNSDKGYSVTCVAPENATATLPVGTYTAGRMPVTVGSLNRNPRGPTGALFSCANPATVPRLVAIKSYEGAGLGGGVVVVCDPISLR